MNSGQMLKVSQSMAVFTSQFKTFLSESSLLWIRLSADSSSSSEVTPTWQRNTQD